MSNADRIKNMTIEELADFLCVVKADYQESEQYFPNELDSNEWIEWLEETKQVPDFCKIEPLVNTITIPENKEVAE